MSLGVSSLRKARGFLPVMSNRTSPIAWPNWPFGVDSDPKAYQFGDRWNAILPTFLAWSFDGHNVLRTFKSSKDRIVYIMFYFLKGMTIHQRAIFFVAFQCLGMLPTVRSSWKNQATRAWLQDVVCDDDGTILQKTKVLGFGGAPSLLV